MPTRADVLAVRRLQRLADRLEPQVRARVLAALEQLRDSVDVEALAKMLARHDVFGLHDLAASLPRRLRPAMELLERETRTVAAQQAGALRAAGVAIRMDLVDQAAVKAAREAAARLVTGVTRETQLAIREIVARAFAEGIPPREMARLIQPLIGLTRAQATAVEASRVAAISRGVARETALRTAERNAERQLKRRAMTIARTETIGASTRGQIETWQTATRTGLLPQGMQKVWITTPDDITCKWCRPLDGTSVPLGGLFRSGRSLVQGPPLHPNCRCGLAVQTMAKTQRMRRAA